MRDFYKGWLSRFVWPGLLALLAALLLSVHLAADAREGDEDSAGLHFDPPSKCHNARNLMLYDQWVVDEWTPFIHGPLHTVLQAGVFRVFGVGVVQMRLLSVLCAAGIVFLLYHVLRVEWGPVLALLTSSLLIINMDFFIYGRSGLLEPLMMFFMLLAALWLQRGYRAAEQDRPRLASLYFAGVALSLMAAFLSKAIAFYFLFAVLILVLARPPARWSAVWTMLGSLAVMVALYLGVFMRVFAPYFDREGDFWMERAGAASIWDLWMVQPLYYQLFHTAIISTLATLAVAWAFHDVHRRATRSRHIVSAVMALTLILGSQFLAFVDYRPQRYYVPLMIPFFVLLAGVIYRALRWAEATEPTARAPVSRYLLSGLVLAFLFGFSRYSPLRMAVQRFDGLDVDRKTILLAAAGLGAVLPLAWWGGRSVVMRGLCRVPLRLRQMAVGILALGLCWAYAERNIESLGRFTRHPHHTMRDFSIMLGQRYQEMTIAGISPLFAVMENTHEARKLTDYNLNWDVLGEGEATHIVMPRRFGHHLRWYRSQFPEAMANATPVDRVTIAGYTHVLFALDLQPLNAHVDPTHGIAAWRNPDPHTPQGGCLVSLDPDHPDPRFLDLDVPPLDLRTCPVNPAAIHALIPHESWTRLTQRTLQHRARSVSDPDAHDIHAYVFQPRSRDRRNRFEAWLSRPREAGDPPTRLAAVRLRGPLNPDDELWFEWMDGDQATQQRRVTPEMLADGRYHWVGLPPVAPATGYPRLRYHGSARPRIDAFLLLGNEASLREQSLWFSPDQDPGLQEAAGLRIVE